MLPSFCKPLLYSRGVHCSGQLLPMLQNSCMALGLHAQQHAQLESARPAAAKRAALVLGEAVPPPRRPPAQGLPTALPRPPSAPEQHSVSCIGFEALAQAAELPCQVGHMGEACKSVDGVGTPCSLHSPSPCAAAALFWSLRGQRLVGCCGGACVAPREARAAGQNQGWRVQASPR